MEETGWLIEQKHGYAEWLFVNEEWLRWTKDSEKALRFSRQEDAECLRVWLGLVNCTVTEHMWEIDCMECITIGKVNCSEHGDV